MYKGGELIPDDLKNHFRYGFGLIKTDDPNLDDTTQRFFVALNGKDKDGVQVVGDLDNVIDFFEEVK